MIGQNRFEKENTGNIAISLTKIVFSTILSTEVHITFLQITSS